jgi:uncharacterized membrane protein YfcA
MEALEQLPMSGGSLVLASLVVCAGTALQAATGVGLGLLAGPILILTLDSQTAIFVAILLNLMVSLALLPQERGEILWSPLRQLLAGTFIGVPVGWFLLQQMSAMTLKLFVAAVVLGAGLQLVLAGRSGRAQSAPQDRPLTTVLGGGVSGVMSGCLAIPGPIALWTLLRQGQPPRLIRATLRALFIFSYGAAFAIHFGFGSHDTDGWIVLATLLPALVIGLGLGAIIKRRVAETMLLNAFKVLLLAMGASLLLKGLADVAT